jgi:twitching motility protein PilI
MAERVSLRDYQRELAERLRDAGASGTTSKLAVQAGAERWLVDLAEANEVIPVPPITPVAQTRAWFKGLANVRGHLYSVVDFPAFLGGAPVPLTEQSRLLLVADRFRAAAALLVTSSLGLRNPGQWQVRQQAAPGEAGNNAPAWIRAEYVDEAGVQWKELDVAGLVRDESFLVVGT